jgi:hypothetical protein
MEGEFLRNWKRMTLPLCMLPIAILPAYVAVADAATASYYFNYFNDALLTYYFY